MALFLSTGQVPLDVMEGWLEHVARLNPMTYVLDLARQGFIGEITWADTWPGLVVIVASAAAFGLWSHRGLRRLTTD